MRAIYQNGNIYEGNMTPDGKLNGWGILYTSSKNVDGNDDKGEE